MASSLLLCLEDFSSSSPDLLPLFGRTMHSVWTPVPRPSGQASSELEHLRVSSQGFLGPRLFPGPQPGPVTLNPSCTRTCSCSSEVLGLGSGLWRNWGGSVWTECPQDSVLRAGLGSSPFTALELLCALSSRQVWAPSRLGWPPSSVKL